VPQKYARKSREVESIQSDESVLAGIPDVAMLTGKTAEATSSVATVSFPFNLSR
jgi:hypothetical protein